MKLSDYYYEWLNKYKWDADRRLKLLMKVEWVWMPGHPWQCLICQQERDTGHSGDCELAKELSDA